MEGQLSKRIESKDWKWQLSSKKGKNQHGGKEIQKTKHLLAYLCHENLKLKQVSLWEVGFRAIR